MKVAQMNGNAIATRLNASADQAAKIERLKAECRTLSHERRAAERDVARLREEHGQSLQEIVRLKADAAEYLEASDAWDELDFCSAQTNLVDPLNRIINARRRLVDHTRKCIASEQPGADGGGP